MMTAVIYFNLLDIYLINKYLDNYDNDLEESYRYNI